MNKSTLSTEPKASARLLLDGIEVLIPEKRFSWLTPEELNLRKDLDLEVVTFPYSESRWRQWKSANHDGFVFTQQDTRRSKNFLVMHRPECSLIEVGEVLHGSRNTKNKVMICAHDLYSLQAYAVYINDAAVRGAGPFRGEAGGIRTCTKCFRDMLLSFQHTERFLEYLDAVPFITMPIDDVDIEFRMRDEWSDEVNRPTEHSLAIEPLAEEVADASTYMEGTTKSIKVNAYERNSKARAACLRHHGYNCQVCGFDFEKIYGEFARGFIHVHHLIPLHTIESTYEVDPINDLIPVCPNCHAAIHLGGETLSIEELKKIFMSRRVQ